MIRPYKPSSGTEGADFMEVFCDRCTLTPSGKAYLAGDADV